VVGRDGPRAQAVMRARGVRVAALWAGRVVRRPPGAAEAAPAAAAAPLRKQPQALVHLPVLARASVKLQCRAEQRKAPRPGRGRLRQPLPHMMDMPACARPCANGQLQTGAAGGGAHVVALLVYAVELGLQRRHVRDHFARARTRRGEGPAPDAQPSAAEWWHSG